MIPLDTPTTKTPICSERQRLTDELIRCTRELVEIHEQDMADLISSTSLPVSDVVVEQARLKRDQARRALMRHVREHDCADAA
jgi:hypothetical protein